MADIVIFPQSRVAKLRLRLSRCHSHRMLDAWTAAFKVERRHLTDRETVELIGVACGKHYALSMAEQAA